MLKCWPVKEVMTMRRKHRKSMLQFKMEEYRRRFLLKTLRRCKWNVAKTALALGLFRHVVYNMIKGDPILTQAFTTGRVKEGIRARWPDHRRSRWLRKSTSRKS